MKAALTALALVVTAGCQSTVFHNTAEDADDSVAIVISNEPLGREQYEVKGIVVAERINYFIDAWGFVNSRESALSDVITDDIEDELKKRAKKLGANAIVDVRVLDYKYHSGCGHDAPWIPFGFASMSMQATAVHIKDATQRPSPPPASGAQPLPLPAEEPAATPAPSPTQ